MNLKNILNLLIFSASLFIVAYSAEEQQNYAQLFEQANSLYKQDKFDEALNLYKKIPNGGAIVSYNMGNCAYKLNNYGAALAFWRRAERNWGFGESAELLNNIKLLKNKLAELSKDPNDKPKDVFLQKIQNLKIYFDFFIHSTPIIFFQIVFLLLWLFMFIAIRKLFRGKKKSVIAILFTTVAIFGLILVCKYNFEIKQHGVIVGKKANILSGPGHNYQVLSFTPEASEVIIEKEVDGFYKIKFGGQIGWIDKKSVEKF